MRARAVLYCDLKSLNDATLYYVDILKQALVEEGFEWSIVHKLNQIGNAQIIVTITAQYFLWAKLRYPLRKTVFWAQGVSAEEAKIRIQNISSRVRYIFRRVVEPIAIKHSTLLLCVSNRMVEYYTKEYGLKENANVIIMPCYNLSLDTSYNEERYKIPSFVYAGGASSWQCIDTMLDVYAYIEERMPNANLTILSNNTDIFLTKIAQRNIQNFSIKYVQVEELQDELKNYKYGFVLRDKHIINEVATPTKMNSYLASLLIPIFSDGVDDFKRNINLGEFKLMAECPLNVETIGNMVIKFENCSHRYIEYAKTVSRIFEEHYNDARYINEIRSKISSMY